MNVKQYPGLYKPGDQTYPSQIGAISGLPLQGFFNVFQPKGTSSIKGDSVLYSRQQSVEKKYNNYYRMLKLAFEKHRSKLMGVSFNEIQKLFTKFFQEYLKINVDSEESFISFTTDQSLYIKSIVKGFNVYTEIYFDGDDEETVVNIYKNKECIISYCGTIDDVISKIKETVQNPRKDNLQYTPTMYLSGSIVTQEEF